ncbi:MAG: hypothetical protein ABEN55_14525, partial [Bradymonadaceae bacterium]
SLKTALASAGSSSSGASAESAESHSGLFDDVDGDDDGDKTSLPSAPKLGGEDEGESANDSFADSVSQSLLMQIDKIQDEGKGKRYGLIGGAVVFALTAAGVWYYVWSSAPKKDELKVQDDGPDIVTENVGEPGQKTYSEEERQKILTISPQKVEKDEKAESDEAREGSEGGSDDGAVEQRRVARKDSPDKESEEELQLRGPATSGDEEGPSMDKALAGAQKRSGEEEGVDRNMGGSEGATATAQVDDTKVNDSRDFEAMETLEGSSANIERSDDSANSGGGGNNGLPGKLSKQQIRDGIKNVRESVASCRRRHARRGVPVDAKKVKMILTVEPTGDVSDFSLSPESLTGTVFEKCLHSHKGRWSFGKFQGSAQKMKAPFILSQ